MKQIKIDINILGDGTPKPLDEQDFIFDQLKEQILRECNQGEIFFDNNDPEKDNIRAWYTIKVNHGEQDYKLIIANSRGKKPVIKDLDKCLSIIRGLFIELNYSNGKNALIEASNNIYEILKHNK